MNNYALTPEEIAQLRADTPGTANLIHFNNGRIVASAACT